MVQCCFILNNHKTPQLIWAHCNDFLPAQLSGGCESQLTSTLIGKVATQEKGFLLGFITFPQMTVALTSYT